MTPDEKERLRGTELWVAMHDDCPWPGCAGCSYQPIAASDDDWSFIQRAAFVLGVDTDVFLLHSAQEGLKIVLGKVG